MMGNWLVCSKKGIKVCVNVRDSRPLLIRWRMGDLVKICFEYDVITVSGKKDR